MDSFTGSITYNWPVQKDGGSSKGGKKYFRREKSNVLKSIQIAVKCVTIDWRCQTAKILFAFQRPPSPTKSVHIVRWRSANKNIPYRNPKPPPLLPITKPFLPQTPIWFSKVFKGDESLGLYTSGHGDFHMEEPMLFSGRSRQFSLTFDIQYLIMTSWSNFGNWNTLNKPFPQILISAIIFFLSSADCNNTNTEVYWYCW